MFTDCSPLYEKLNSWCNVYLHNNNSTSQNVWKGHQQVLAISVPHRTQFSSNFKSITWCSCHHARKVPPMTSPTRYNNNHLDIFKLDNTAEFKSSLSWSWIEMQQFIFYLCQSQAKGCWWNSFTAYSHISVWPNSQNFTPWAKLNSLKQQSHLVGFILFVINRNISSSGRCSS